MSTPTPAQLIRIEAEALLRLAARLEDGMSADFARAVELVVECGRRRGRVVVTGIGKSGIIAQKLVATFNSTGTPALFLHPAEALHGDLGMLAKGDLVLALSSSGETDEILRLLPTIKRMGDALISFCCAMNSTLALASDVALDVSVEQEACGMGLAPTASTTVMLALGDALAIAVSLQKGLPRGRLRRPASRRQAGQKTSPGRGADARRGCDSQGLRCHAYAGGDLRDEPQRPGNDHCDRRRRP